MHPALSTVRAQAGDRWTVAFKPLQPEPRTKEARTFLMSHARLGHILNPVPQCRALYQSDALSTLSTWTSGCTFKKFLSAEIFNSVAGVPLETWASGHMQAPAAPTKEEPQKPPRPGLRRTLSPGGAPCPGWEVSVRSAGAGWTNCCHPPSTVSSQGRGRTSELKRPSHLQTGTGPARPPSSASWQATRPLGAARRGEAAACAAPPAGRLQSGQCRQTARRSGCRQLGVRGVGAGE